MDSYVNVMVAGLKNILSRDWRNMFVNDGLTMKALVKAP